MPLYLGLPLAIGAAIPQFNLMVKDKLYAKVKYMVQIHLKSCQNGCVKTNNYFQYHGRFWKSVTKY